MNERDPQLSALWRDAAHPAPPPALDAAVRAAAEAAAQAAGPPAAVKPSAWWLRWQSTFALASIAVVSATLTLMMHAERERSEAAAVAPATARPPLGVPPAPGAAPPAADAAGQPQPTAPVPQVSTNRAHERSVTPGSQPTKAKLAPAPTAAAPFSPKQAPVADTAAESPLHAAPRRTEAEAAAAPPRPAAVGEVAGQAVGQAAGHSVGEAALSASAPPSPAARAEPRSAAPAARTMDASPMRQDERAAKASATAESAAGDRAASELIRRIRAARAEGEIAEAQRLLQQLRSRYPDLELPPDLREPAR